MNGIVALKRSLIAFACLLLLAAAAAARAALVDGIIAVVNNEVITASELDFTAALNERLGGGGDGKRLRAETLEGLITRRLLVQEARRLTFVEITDREIEAEKNALVKRFGSEEEFSGFLKHAGLSEPELRRVIGEQTLVRKFIEKKFGLFVRVTREEAEQYYNAHRNEYPDRDFSEVQKSIMARLGDERVGRQLDQYTAELRARADIRINAASGEPAG